jgi:hypothetical protein
MRRNFVIDNAALEQFQGSDDGIAGSGDIKA